MPQTPWTDNESEQAFDPLDSLIADWLNPDAAEDDFRSDFFQGMAGRRQKAAFVLMAIWSLVMVLHSVSWGYGIVLALGGLLSLQALRLMAAKPEPLLSSLPLETLTVSEVPRVSLLVAAKNEEAVIQPLVEQLCHLDYPTDRYDVWIIDDASTDKTPQILDELVKRYANLQVVHRPAGSQGGKSGALNEVLARCAGEIIGVFDADAQVPGDLLREVVPYFAQEKMGAVQVRKAIANGDENFWTRGQAIEMALDTYFQQQRIVTGGIGELRGNGQFVAREALNHCGGWNEETITDDLDLTIRLHLDDWKIGVLPIPPVQEEGVTTAIALWHQRNRWAEGGYQRYLDYWRPIMGQPLGWRKKLDLVSFMLMQYLLPTAAIPDLVVSLIRHHWPILTPLTYVAIAFSGWGMYHGLRRLEEPGRPLHQIFLRLGQTILGTLYMLHWLVIMPCVTARMAIRPKRLKWVKTVHGGHHESTLELGMRD
ncbi:MAG: glycosyltransferase [Microcystaceae cyanobacterium]